MGALLAIGKAAPLPSWAGWASDLRPRIRWLFRRPSFGVQVASGLFIWLSLLGFVLPYDPDEAVYKVVATGILDGQWPYRDLFDHKPPVTYAWYLPTALGASIRIERVLAALMLAASVVLMSKIADRMLGRREARVATVSYAVLLAGPIMAIGANTEAFMMAPLLGAVVVSSPLTAGVLLGIAIMTKPVAVAYLPLLIVMRRSRRQGWWITGATIATVMAMSAAFLPVWRDYLNANVMFNLWYGADVTPANRLRDLVSLNPFVLISALPIWIAAVVGAFSRRDPLILFWTVVGFATVKATGRDYAYYYAPMLPPIALLAGQGFGTLLRPAIMRAVAGATATASIVAASVAIAMGWRVGEDYEAFTAAVRATSGEAYVLGDDARVYAYTGRQPGRRFFYSVPMSINKRWGAAARNELLACAPHTLVVPRDPSTPFPLTWGAEIEAMYQRRADYAAGTVFTEPTTTCELAGPEAAG